VSCGNPHELDCGEVLDRVYDYLDGEMDAEDAATFHRHLEECAPCLRQYDLDIALKVLVRRSCQCEPAPQALRSRIMIQIREVRVQLGR
jgi:mycothiol system anti-sigma-R factor